MALPLVLLFARGGAAKNRTPMNRIYSILHDVLFFLLLVLIVVSDR